MCSAMELRISLATFPIITLGATSVPKWIALVFEVISCKINKVRNKNQYSESNIYICCVIAADYDRTDLRQAMLELEPGN